MKKSSFVALVMGTVSGVFFALGMCMALLPEWGVQTQGITCGIIGIVLSLITWLIWRKMEHKAPIKVSGKTILSVIVGIVGGLLLGVGMCMVMLAQNIILGIAVGIIGIVVLMMLIPLIKGLK